jgi:hypothetical protein
MSRRDAYDEIHAEALRVAARERQGTLRQLYAECYPTVTEMLAERYPPATGCHQGRPGHRQRKGTRA